METRNRKNSKNTETKKIMENFNLYQILTAQLFDAKKRGNSGLKHARLLIQSIVIAFIFTASVKAYSQDLASQISKMAEDSSRQYTQILTNSLSSGLNSGMFQVTKPGNKFSIYLGVKASATFLGAEDKLPGTVTEVPAIPFAVIQLGIGSVAGTDVMFRYLPKINLGNYASVSAWGIGLQHSLAKDFSMPIDVRFAASIHNLKINDSKGKDLISMNSWSAGTTVSKSFGIFTLYTTFQYEKSNSVISYSIDEPVKTNVRYSQENNNNIRTAGGFNLKMGPVNLTADYNFGKNNAVSMGLGFGF